MPTPRWMKNEGTQPVDAVVATAQAVTTGDLTGLVSNTLVRAEDIAWDTDLATTQTAFATAFLGVSGQTKAANTARPYGNSEDNKIRVDTAGEIEFDCASASFNMGDYVGAAKQSGNALESQKVVGVATEARAIGKVCRTVTSTTRVRVRLLTNILPLAQQA